MQLKRTETFHISLIADFMARNVLHVSGFSCVRIRIEICTNTYQLLLPAKGADTPD